jgi:GntR family transcriptional regulator / MocR family aminotransferase
MLGQKKGPKTIGSSAPSRAWPGTSRLRLTARLRSLWRSKSGRGIADAIDNGLLVPGARLPSWRDLAAQLGVARGTVRTAYERLAAAQLIVWE